MITANSFFGFKTVDVISKVCIKFHDTQIGRKAMISNESTRANYIVPIKKCETGITI